MDLPASLKITKINGLPFIRMSRHHKDNVKHLLMLAKNKRLIMVSHRHSRTLDPCSGHPNSETLTILQEIYTNNPNRIFWLDTVFFSANMPYEDRAYLFPEVWVLYRISDQAIIADQADINRLWISAEIMMISSGQKNKSQELGELIYSSIDIKYLNSKNSILHECLERITSGKIEDITLSMLNESQEFEEVWEAIKRLLCRTTVSLNKIDYIDQRDLLWVVVSLLFVQASINRNESYDSKWLSNVISQYKKIILNEYNGWNGKIGWFFNWKLGVKAPWDFVDEVFQRCIVNDLQALLPGEIRSSSGRYYMEMYPERYKKQLLLEFDSELAEKEVAKIYEERQKRAIELRDIEIGLMA